MNSTVQKISFIDFWHHPQYKYLWHLYVVILTTQLAVAAANSDHHPAHPSSLKGNITTQVKMIVSSLPSNFNNPSPPSTQVYVRCNSILQESTMH